jgi:hypothetical protein
MRIIENMNWIFIETDLETKCIGLLTFYVVYNIISIVYIRLQTIFSSQRGEELQDFPDNDKNTGFYDPKILSESSRV